MRSYESHVDWYHQQLDSLLNNNKDQSWSLINTPIIRHDVGTLPASLVFGIHRWPMNSAHKGPVMSSLMLLTPQAILLEGHIHTTPLTGWAGVGLTHWPLGDIGAILKLQFSISFYWLVSSHCLMIMYWDECQGTSPTISQHWFSNPRLYKSIVMHGKFKKENLIDSSNVTLMSKQLRHSQ